MRIVIIQECIYIPQTGFEGAHGATFPARSAVCFEAEYMPNAINYPDVEQKPVLRAGDIQKHEIQYRLKVK